MPVVVNKLGEHRNEQAVENLICYMAVSKHTVRLGGRGIQSIRADEVIQDFDFVKQVYRKDDRKQVSHIIIGAGKKEGLIEDELVGIAEYAAAYFYQRGFQSFYVVHRGSEYDPDYIHIHMAVNTINFTDGKRYYETYGNASDLKNVLSMAFSGYAWRLINDNSSSWEE